MGRRATACGVRPDASNVDGHPYARQRGALFIDASFGWLWPISRSLRRQRRGERWLAMHNRSSKFSAYRRVDFQALVGHLVDGMAN